jgi:hypothetical protein
MLVIQAQGKHSPCVTLPDRFIGVDDVNSPLSTPAFAEILFGQREAVMSLMVSNEANPRHTFDSAEMGAIAHLYRGEVYRSTTG